MKRILLLLILSFPGIAQSYKIAVGSNITTYVFTNSAGVTPSFLRPATGLHFSLSRENKLSKNFVYDLGIAYNQFNNIGDTQKIPFSYSADFIGLSAGLGIKLPLGKGYVFIPKINVAASKLVNGHQFLLNRYIDLTGDDQFNSLKSQFGYSVEINKKVIPNISVFAKFQHLDNFDFGNSTISFIPSTFSIGLSIDQ
jgi:hypothetical protein